MLHGPFFSLKVTHSLSPVGFAFSTYADSGLGQTCVTKVTVSFEKFGFVVRLHALEIEHVKTEVVQALQSALKFEADCYPIFSFMRF